MERQVTERKCIDIDWSGYYNVKNMMEIFQGYIDEYGEDVVIYSESFGYDGPDEFFLRFNRDETPEESKLRLATERKEKERKRKIAVRKREKLEALVAKETEQEKLLYEKLHKKYG